jgi:PqqA peptide cyclase
MSGGTPRPYTLIAELTYACPLHCAYCSNPVELGKVKASLTTSQWVEVFHQAEELGVVQLNLTGGEPLLRPDLEALVQQATALGLYVNLITSAVPLDRARLEGLRDAGLASIQISFQDVDADAAREIAGADHLVQKKRVARWATELSLPLTLNVVLHRANIDRVDEFVALAESLHARRLELASTQYLGWALKNRDALLPSLEQIDGARRAVDVARDRLREKLELLFVMPDYFSGRPRACMDGWARRYVLVTPDGLVLPCHAAASIPGLRFERVLEHSLAAIWQSSEGLNAFRGEQWMSPTCRSCERRALDFAGCRCQAYALTGDARATDPSCALSPQHALVQKARAVRSPIVSLRRAR